MRHYSYIFLSFLPLHAVSQEKGDASLKLAHAKKSYEELKISPVTIQEDGVNHTEVYIFRYKNEFADVATVSNSNYDYLHTFCYKGVPASISLFWSSASFILGIDGNDYRVYIGPNVTVVAHMAQESETAWLYTQLPWRSKYFKFSTFEDVCVGVHTSQAYKMTLQWMHVNFVQVIATMVGLCVFCMAPTLCRNTFFHYTTGIGMGLLLSILVLTFLLQRRFQQSLFSWIGVAYSFSIYLMTRTWFNIKEWLTTEYYIWVVGYVLCAGIVSFAVVYRMGPPTNHRTLNLIQWSMQLASLVTIVMSSYFQSASLLLALLLVFWAAIPPSFKSAVQTRVIKTFFKPELKLLTEDEYHTQGVVETKKALEQLKDYCRSPECKPWQTVSRLKSPVRFAEFIEGSPHLAEEEVMEYSHFDYNTTDDEEDEEEILTDDEDAEDAGQD